MYLVITPMAPTPQVFYQQKEAEKYLAKCLHIHIKADIFVYALHRFPAEYVSDTGEIG